MALIGKIRKNSWVMIVLVALGLGGFIVMDMTSGQQSVFGSSQTVVGNINGSKVDWNQFSRVDQMMYDVLYRNSTTDAFTRRTLLWNYYVEEAIIKEEADLLGLGVSKAELLDLQFGANPSPVIQARFRNPATNAVDFQQLNQFKQAIETGQFTDPLLRSFWRHQEQEIMKDRLESKLSTMVSKAIYSPNWMVEMSHSDQQNIDFAYVKVPFDEMDNSEVTVDEADLKKFETEKKGVCLFDILKENRNFVPCLFQFSFLIKWYSFGRLFILLAITIVPAMGKRRGVGRDGVGKGVPPVKRYTSMVVKYMKGMAL